MLAIITVTNSYCQLLFHHKLVCAFAVVTLAAHLFPTPAIQGKQWLALEWTGRLFAQEQGLFPILKEG